MPSGSWQGLVKTQPGRFTGVGIEAGTGPSKSIGAGQGARDGFGVRIRCFSCSSSVMGYARSGMTGSLPCARE